MATVQILFSWSSKSLWMVTAAMKLRHLLLGRKSMTNLDSILKSTGITLLTKVHLVKAMVNLDSILKNRDITLPRKVHIVKAIVFPIVMYRYES